MAHLCTGLWFEPMRTLPIVTFTNASYIYREKQTSSLISAVHAKEVGN